MLIRINLLSVLITLCCFTISLGCIAPTNARGYGLLVFLLMVPLNGVAIFRQIFHRPIRLGLQILGMLICLGIILSTDRPYVWVIWYVPLLCLFFEMSPTPRGFPSQMYLVWTSLLFSICYTANFHSSRLWFLLQKFSTQISHVLGQITGTQVFLGATGAGFWIFFLSFLCLFFSYRSHRNRYSPQRALFAVAVGYLVILYFAYIAYGQNLFQILYETTTPLFDSKSRSPSNLAATSMSSPLIFGVLAVGVSIIFVPKLLKSKEQATFPLDRKRVTFCAISAGAVLIASLFFYIPSPSMGTSAPYVTFYGKGLLYWNTPQFGRYGTAAAGMFGLLP